MKKIIALILCISALLLNVGCKKEKYPEIESTKEEARVMMSFDIDGEKYEMKYELYRALFLNFSNRYDNGDKSFWDKESSKAALDEINAEILEYTLDIFATLHVAKSIGFDPYSKDAEQTIKDYIIKSVEGDGETIIGFGGDYDAYLESLKAANVNYSVQKLLLRYSISYDRIIAHYEGTVNENNPSESTGGALQFTREDVLSFYNGNDAVRVSPVTLKISYEKSLEIRNKIADADTMSEALEIAIKSTTASETDIFDGVVIGTHTLDKAYYNDVTAAAFALKDYETSELITVATDYGTEYWILYKQPKSQEHFDKCYNDMVSVYKSQKIGETINSVKERLKSTLSETEVYKNLKHSDISMK